jgi:hypothetical protein
VLGITGMLLYDDATQKVSPLGVETQPAKLISAHTGQAFQILEGPEEAVKHIFSKIEKDTRHCDIKVLQAKATPRRVFPAGEEFICEGAGEAEWGYITSDIHHADINDASVERFPSPQHYALLVVIKSDT